MVVLVFLGALVFSYSGGGLPPSEGMCCHPLTGDCGLISPSQLLPIAAWTALFPMAEASENLSLFTEPLERPPRSCL